MPSTPTARRKPKPPQSILNTPATQVITCARAGCGREFPAAEDRSALEPFPGAGDFRAVRDSSRVAGWLHDEEIGDVCPSHRDHVSRWPGAPRLALPARAAGSTRAEFLGVVPQAALPGGEPRPESDLEFYRRVDATLTALEGRTDPLAEYQALSNELHYAEQDAVCSFCGEKPSEGVTLIWAQDRWQCSNSDACRERCIAQEGSDDEDEPQPGGTIYPDLLPEALAGGVPLESLAPGHEDEEAEA